MKGTCSFTNVQMFKWKERVLLQMYKCLNGRNVFFWMFKWKERVLLFFKTQTVAPEHRVFHPFRLDMSSFKYFQELHLFFFQRHKLSHLSIMFSTPLIGLFCKRDVFHPTNCRTWALCFPPSSFFVEGTLQHTATHCNTLQHTATPCNSLTQKIQVCLFCWKKSRSSLNKKGRPVLFGTCILWNF